MAKIHVLPPETARLIAAGEVIDRPAAVLREFLDNAIDSGATEVSVEIEGGGTDLIRVVDDGGGMSREDLELSILPHATSKISRADDLLTATTLGFRGEALASIASAARLEITSREETSAEAWRLCIGLGSKATLNPGAGRRGTRAESSRLFENYPARRQFLKHAQAEAMICRQTFIDKALSHPELAMRYTSEKRLSLSLLPSSPEERVAAIHPELDRSLVYRVRFSGSHCEGFVVLSSPAFYRTDRRLMQVFVNRRRVTDSNLLQGLDHAFSGFLPGGAHPAAFLFAQVDPAFADFNIHPAKREVRFKDIQSLRQAFVHAIQAFLLDLSRREPEKATGSAWKSLEFPLPGYARGDEGVQVGGGYGRGDRGAWSGARQPSSAWDDFATLRERSLPQARAAAASGAPPSYEEGPPRLRFIGRAFGLFLIAEAGESLYLIDQHAAHERSLFDRYMATAPAAQELLVPAVFEAEDDAEDRLLAEAAVSLGEFGFRIKREGTSWAITALPSPLDRDPVGAVKEIVSMMAGTGEHSQVRHDASPRDPSRGLLRHGAREAALATAACRAAVKDGDELDDAAAEALVRLALALPQPRCPHGRPVWARLTRSELFALVRRTV